MNVDMTLKEIAAMHGVELSTAPAEPKNRLEELALDGHYTLSPETVASFLGIHPQKLRDLARDEKSRSLLGFPVIAAGRTVLFPKVPFLRFMGYEGEVVLT